MKLSKETKVGILAITAGAMLFFGINYMKGEDAFSPRKKYHVIFNSVDGLAASNPIYVNGINVGKVGTLELLENEQHNVLATLEINREIKVGDSTIAMLSTAGLLGGKSVVLLLGNNNKLFESGDTISGMKEKGIQEMISEKALPIIGNLDTTIIRLNRILGDKMGKSINGILTNAELASLDLRYTMAHSKNNLVGITQNLNALSLSLKETERSVKPLLIKMNALADSLNDLELKKVVDNAALSMKNIAEITSKIDKNQGSMGLLVNDKEFYNNLNSSAKDLDNLLIDMKARPSRYIHFSVFGKKEKKSKEEKTNPQPSTSK
ncbi:MAG: MCE family protein [Cytophagales bacterium]|nr:MAG: MCE family protein [Cytophagales bacterium]